MGTPPFLRRGVNNTDFAQSLFYEKLGKPKPGDWLSTKEEKGQTFSQYKLRKPRLPTKISPIERYKTLILFCEKNGLKEEMGFYKKMLKVISD